MSASILADDSSMCDLPIQPQLHWARLLWRGCIAITTPALSALATYANPLHFGE
jgi:hypothetical protein